MEIAVAARQQLEEATTALPLGYRGRRDGCEVFAQDRLVVGTPSTMSGLSLASGPFRAAATQVTS